ncbi:MAG TPA: hypothetical protein PLN69_00035 [bacterium]|nr:hypothetical protein [bacterium]
MQNWMFIFLLLAGVGLFNAVLWVIVIKVIRGRYGERPAGLRGVEKPMVSASSGSGGYYLETRIEGGGRFYGWGLLARGNGTLYLGGAGLYFLRAFTRDPIFIPFGAVRAVSVGPSGSARTGRLPMIHVYWEWEDRRLVSLFAVSGRPELNRQWAERVESAAGVK